MNNEEKQHLASIEWRVQKLETIIQGMYAGMQEASARTFSCGVCGAYEPLSSGHICSTPGCKMGLNPNDDN